MIPSIYRIRKNTQLTDEYWILITTNYSFTLPVLYREKCTTSSNECFTSDKYLVSSIAHVTSNMANVEASRPMHSRLLFPQLGFYTVILLCALDWSCVHDAPITLMYSTVRTAIRDYERQRSSEKVYH